MTVAACLFISHFPLLSSLISDALNFFHSGFISVEAESIGRLWKRRGWKFQPLTDFKDFVRESPNNGFEPLTGIRDYFGEKVAFLFAFSSHYTALLVFTAVPGMALFLWQWVLYFR